MDQCSSMLLVFRYMCLWHSFVTRKIRPSINVSPTYSTCACIYDIVLYARISYNVVLMCVYELYGVVQCGSVCDLPYTPAHCVYRIWNTSKTCERMNKKATYPLTQFLGG